MTIPAGQVFSGRRTPLVHEPMDAKLTLGGDPQTGYAMIGEYDGHEVGVWEMTPGTVSDVEVDEVFVVLSGHGRIQFTDRPLPSIDLGPGDVVRLEAGMNTVWTVTHTLRKISIA